MEAITTVMNIPVPVLIAIIILFAISVIAIALSYFKDKSIESIRKDVYKLFIYAEHRYKASSSGKQKMKHVVSTARRMLPGWVQALVSEEALEKFIQIWFDEIKDLLDDGRVNGSQKTSS